MRLKQRLDAAVKFRVANTFAIEQGCALCRRQAQSPVEQGFFGHGKCLRSTLLARTEEIHPNESQRKERTSSLLIPKLLNWLSRRRMV
jgi:hypothetical protein